MASVCTARLKELRANDGPDSNTAVESEITNLLAGKTLVQLEQLEGSVRAKLSSGEPVDTDYWEGLLTSLKVWKAKVRRRSFLSSRLRNQD